MSKNSNSREEPWIHRCFPFLSKDPTHPLQIALRTYALALSLSLGPSFFPLIVATFTRLINVKSNGSSTKSDLATLKRVLRRELGHDGFAFSVTLSIAGGAAIRDLFRSANVYDQQLDATYGSNGSRIEETGSMRGVRRVLQLFKGYLLSASPEQQTFISNLISSSTGILLLQAGRARTVRLRAASKPISRLGYVSPTLDLTLLLLVRAVDSIVQTFILQKSQLIVGYVNNTPPGDQPVAELDSSSGNISLEYERQHPDPRIVHNKLAMGKDPNKIRLKLASRLDAFVFWACSARYVF